MRSECRHPKGWGIILWPNFGDPHVYQKQNIFKASFYPLYMRRILLIWKDKYKGLNFATLGQTKLLLLLRQFILSGMKTIDDYLMSLGFFRALFPLSTQYKACKVIATLKLKCNIQCVNFICLELA